MTAADPFLDIPAEVLASRRRTLLAHAAERGLRAVVVFGHGSGLGAGTKSHGALRFLADWDAHESTSLLVCTERQTTLLVASPFVVPLARQRRPDLALLDVRPVDWSAAIATLLPGGSAVATVGMDEIPAPIREALDAGCGAKDWESIDAVVDQMRARLDEVQLRRHRCAASLCDDMFSRLGAQLRQGRPAWQVQRHLEAFALHEGADYCRTWLTVGPQADYPRYWREECMRVPTTGDQVLFGIMLTVQGHWGHGIRMGSMGRPQEPHVALWRDVEQMLEAGISALRIGKPMQDCERAMQEVLLAKFDADAVASMTRFRNGHGLGLSYEETLPTSVFPQHFGAPALSAPVSVRSPGVESGSLLELHPNLFIPGVGGAAIGEMIFVGEHGVESLIAFPRALQDWS
jgi:Xaa-Pro aminopeptidase